MLRRNSQSPEKPEPTAFVPWPAADEAIVLGNHPLGVHFYSIKGATFYSYASLRRMVLEEQKLILTFDSQEVTLEGEGLHSVYAQIAMQKVRRIHQQPETFRAEAKIFIHTISIKELSVVNPEPERGRSGLKSR